MLESKRLLVLYGTQTFTAQEIAEKIWRTTKSFGFRGPVQAMDDYQISRLIYEEFAIFVCSTAGQGDEPDTMKKSWKFLLKKSLPSNSLAKLKFGVIALGDSSFAKFNYVGKKLHKRLIQLGASPLLDVGLCDYQHDLGHDAVLIPWLKKFWEQLQTYFPNIKINLEDNFVPRWKVELIKDNKTGWSSNNYLNEDIYFRRQQTNFVFEEKEWELLDNVRTTDESHFQDVRLMTFTTVDKVKLSYRPGDLFNLRPRNSTEDIEELFNIFRIHNLDIEPHYRLLVKEFHEGIIK